MSYGLYRDGANKRDTEKLEIDQVLALKDLASSLKQIVTLLQKQAPTEEGFCPGCKYCKG